MFYQTIIVILIESRANRRRCARKLKKFSTRWFNKLYYVFECICKPIIIIITVHEPIFSVVVGAMPHVFRYNRSIIFCAIARTFFFGGTYFFSSFCRTRILITCSFMTTALFIMRRGGGLSLSTNPGCVTAN